MVFPCGLANARKIAGGLWMAMGLPCRFTNTNILAISVTSSYLLILHVCIAITSCSINNQVDEGKKKSVAEVTRNVMYKFIYFLIANNRGALPVIKLVFLTVIFSMPYFLTKTLTESAALKKSLLSAKF